MLTSDFDFHLPDDLIAQYPLEQRSSSRLLAVNKNGVMEDTVFSEFPRFLRPGDLLIFNNTKVIPARLFGRKQTGGKVELLVERLTSDVEALALVKASKSPKSGSILRLEDGTEVEVTGRQDALFQLRLHHQNWLPLLDRLGHMPLPPYISRQDEGSDHERYQTVYAERPGAVAAPTAGLHFDDALLRELGDMGVDSGFVTLHVGAGTFQPVKVENIADHVMHEEYLEVSAELVEQVAQCRQRGGRVVAVGTTSVRSLETAAQSGELKPFSGMSGIFITPGYEFRVVDAMVTNFHLPQSTLLMLVSAFIGFQRTMQAYGHAVKERYRFFSYGDAMFLEKSSHAV